MQERREAQITDENAFLAILTGYEGEIYLSQTSWVITVVHFIIKLRSSKRSQLSAIELLSILQLTRRLTMFAALIEFSMTHPVLF